MSKRSAHNGPTPFDRAADGLLHRLAAHGPGFPQRPGRGGRSGIPAMLILRRLVVDIIGAADGDPERIDERREVILTDSEAAERFRLTPAQVRSACARAADDGVPIHRPGPGGLIVFRVPALPACDCAGPSCSGCACSQCDAPDDWEARAEARRTARRAAEVARHGERRPAAVAALLTDEPRTIREIATDYWSHDPDGVPGGGVDKVNAALLALHRRGLARKITTTVGGRTRVRYARGPS